MKIADTSFKFETIAITKNEISKGWNFVKYDQFFQNQINAGMIEEVNTEELVGNVTYLPHKKLSKIKAQQPKSK